MSQIAIALNGAVITPANNGTTCLYNIVTAGVQSFTFNDVSKLLTINTTNGASFTVNLSSLEETLTSLQLVNKTLTYTAENGIATNLNLPVVTVVNNGNGNFTVNDGAGSSYEIDASHFISSTGGNVITDTNGLYVANSPLVDNADGTFTHTDNNGVAVTFSAEGVFLNNGALVGAAPDGFNIGVDTTTGELYRNNAGTWSKLPFPETNSTLVDNADGTFTYTNEDGVTTTFEGGETTLVDNADGTFTFTAADGSTVDFEGGETTLVDNGNGTLTFTHADGVTVINFNGNTEVVVNAGALAGAAPANAVLGLDSTTGDLYYNNGGTWALVSETITTLVDNGDGTFTHTSEDGTVVTFDNYEEPFFLSSGANPTSPASTGVPTLLDISLNTANLQFSIVSTEAVQPDIDAVLNGFGKISFPWADIAGDDVTIKGEVIVGGAVVGEAFDYVVSADAVAAGVAGDYLMNVPFVANASAGDDIQLRVTITGNSSAVDVTGDLYIA